MLVSIIPIGNSRGVRLPKAILDQLDVSDQMEMEVVDRRIILTPTAASGRAGWKESFARMHAENEDALLLPDSGTTETFEWEW